MDSMKKFEEWQAEALEDTKVNTNVHHPVHYTEYPKEVKAIIREALGDEGYKAYCFGNEIKYRLRAGFKDTNKILEDIQKALFYAEERKNV